MTPPVARRPPRSQSRGLPGSDAPGLAARRTAAKLLSAVIDTHTSLDGLTDNEHGHPHYLALAQRDRALVRAILGSALRHRLALERLIRGRLDRPLPANAHALSHMLHVAVAQILYLDVPDSAAVDLAVESAKADPRTARFAALVNGVLRGIVRAKEDGISFDGGDAAPDWFSARLLEVYGADRAAAILEAHRHEAPVDFTVKADPELWAERLGGMVLPTGSVRVARLDGPVSELPGYADGAWWVQDAAAALPARLIGARTGMSVADLCAAPGGKTAQLALTGASVTAVDISRNRLKRLATNLARLGLSADTIDGDLFAYSPAAPFDAILLDAPCSSTGTIRRHPDVAWTKSAADIAKLAELQARLLRKAFAMLKPGGTLVFSNCSIDPSEGEDVVRTFLGETPEAVPSPIDPAELPGIATFIDRDGWLRTTPADLRMDVVQLSGLDGFFAARFQKRP